MKKRTCLYPGSFDPVTRGHLDLIQRASRMWDTVYVGVLYNPDKQGLFTPDERVALLKEVCSEMDNVQVVLWSGLTVDLLARLKTNTLLRGIRGSSDLEGELPMARINRLLSPDTETVFLTASPECEDISSSIVRQVAMFGGDITALVPAPVADAVKQKYERIKTGGKKNG